MYIRERKRGCTASDAGEDYEGSIKTEGLRKLVLTAHLLFNTALLVRPTPLSLSRAHSPFPLTFPVQY